MTAHLTRRQIQLLYNAGLKAIPDEMRQEATIHGVILEEKRPTSVLTPAEEKAWMVYGIKPERYRKKEDKKNG